MLNIYRSRQLQDYRDVCIECHVSTGTSSVDKSSRKCFLDFTHINTQNTKSCSKIWNLPLFVCTYTSRQPPLSRRGDCLHEFAFITSAARSVRFCLLAVVHAAISTLCTGKKAMFESKMPRAYTRGDWAQQLQDSTVATSTMKPKSDLYTVKTETHRVSAEHTLQSWRFLIVQMNQPERPQ